MGKRMNGLSCRPDEVTVAQARDAVGLVLSKLSDALCTFDFGFVAPDGSPVYGDAKRTALVHANDLQKTATHWRLLRGRARHCETLSPLQWWPSSVTHV